MDEFKNNFDPIDEYAPLEDQKAEKKTFKNAESTGNNKEDDVFDAFDKAQAQWDKNAVNNQNNIPDIPPTPPVQPQQSYAAPQPPQGYNNYQHNAPQYSQYNKPPYQAPPYYNTYNQPHRAPQTQNQNSYNANPQWNTNQNYNPYTQPSVIKPKEKTPTRAKVLIGVLITLLIVFMIAFFVSCSVAVFGNNNNSDSNNPLKEYAEDFGSDSYTDPYSDPFSEFYDEFYSDDFAPDFNFSPSYDSDTFTEDIVLQADDGQTQVKEDDKESNSYSPDKNAKDLKSNALPKDKNNKEYTTQSAYNAVTDSVVSIEVFKDKITDNEEDIISGGTGTIISKDGYILTNSHVIGDSKQYTLNVILNNAKEYKAQVVGYDTRTDLAVIKINAKDLQAVEFGDSTLVEVGQDVVAIGDPGGTSFQNSLTKGIVSAVDRKLELNANVTYIQIDAAINPGNSGGPLCNLYGQVIGINTAKIATESFEGMGFAIPSNTVIDIANDLIHYGYVKGRVRLGLMGKAVDEQMIYQYNVPQGILITGISENGPLDGTKIDVGDIVTKVDGKEVATFQEVYDILSKHKAGDKIEITIFRLKE